MLPKLSSHMRWFDTGVARIRDQIQMDVHRVQGLLALPRPFRWGENALLWPLRSRVSQMITQHQTLDYNKSFFVSNRYHTYCAGLDTIPSGRWQCGKCTVCSSCNVRDPPGTNVLQSEHRWVYEFKTSALSGNKVYSHAMCKPCHRWVFDNTICVSFS